MTPEEIAALKAAQPSWLSDGKGLFPLRRDSPFQLEERAQISYNIGSSKQFIPAGAARIIREGDAQPQRIRKPADAPPPAVGGTCGGSPTTSITAVVSGITACIIGDILPNGSGTMTFIGSGTDPITGDDVCQWSNPSVPIGGAEFNFQLVLFTSGPSTGLWRLKIDNGVFPYFENVPAAFGVISNKFTSIADCSVSTEGYDGSATLS